MKMDGNQLKLIEKYKSSQVVINWVLSSVCFINKVAILLPVSSVLYHHVTFILLRYEMRINANHEQI